MDEARHPHHLEVAVAAIVRENDAKKRESAEILAFWRPKEAIRGGVWQLPGGKVEPPESGEAAAARETLEELGVQIEVVEFLGEASDLDASLLAEQHVRIRAYLATPTTDPWEPTDASVRWIPITDIDEYPWPRANRTINALLRSRFERDK